LKSRIAVLLALVALSALAAAQTLTGTVRNGTTGKAAAHDDVVLIKLAQGMSEAARTKTDAEGHFSFQLGETGPHLVRVNHEGVNYFSPAPPGTNSVEVNVYDAARKLDGITGTVNVMRFQSDGKTLQGIELYAVKNSSTPPRALMNDRPFEFYLPPGAQIDQAAAESPGGQPINISPVPDGNDGRYYVVFPIRPGETQFQIAYHLPYSGQAKIQPRLTLPYEHLAVVMAKTMQFTPDVPGSYSPMSDDTGSTVQVATNVTPGKSVAFAISGSGMLQDSQSAATDAQADAQGGGQDMRPGGGLGAPIDAPDPLHNYRWAILGTLAAVLMAGGFYIMTRSKPALAVAGAPVADRSATLLDALKEELFQLEVDRQQERVSADEYDKAKAALDQTIQRALARKK
jgi:hypothetical protein